MGREYGTTTPKKGDKARCKPTALRFLQTPPLLLVEFAVPFGFDQPAANRGFYEEGDRRGSKSRPLDPRSDKGYLHVLPVVAAWAHRSRFSCSCLPAISGCCALIGVTRGVISASVLRQRLDAPRR